MKKLLAFLLACCLTLALGAASAAGLSTVNALCVVVPAYGDYAAYAYAEVVNTSDKLMMIDYDTSVLTLLDAQGNALKTSPIYSLCPSAIAPGETGFVIIEYESFEADMLEKIDSYSMTINGEEAWYLDSPTALPQESLTAEYVTTKDYFGDTVNWVYVLVENASKGLLFDYCVVASLYDQHGRIIFACEEQTYDVGIPSGQSAMVRMEIPSLLSEYWAANDIVPTQIKVMCICDD